MTTSVIWGVVRDLRRDISLGEFKPGERLRINNIKETYSVSAPTAREALSILCGEKFVQAKEQCGFFVADTSMDELMDITRVRAELECLALQWSITNSSPQWRANIVAAHHLLQESESELSGTTKTSILDWDENNQKFHAALGANAGSDSLIQLIEHQYALSRRYRMMVYADVDENEKHEWLAHSAHEHSELVTAALTGDAATACALLRAHLMKARNHLPTIK